MDYLSDFDLSSLGAKDLLDYYSKLKQRKEDLLNEITLWSSTIRAARAELKRTVEYLEDEIALAELERTDFDDDCIAYNNPLKTVN